MFKQLTIMNCYSLINIHVNLDIFLRHSFGYMGTESHLNEPTFISEVYIEKTKYPQRRCVYLTR